MNPAFSRQIDSRNRFIEGDCFFFWKGRVALHAILKALGVGPGDHVLFPGYTCVVVPAAACFLGAKPLYVDIDPGTYNVSLHAIQRVYSENCDKRIRAVVVQHTYGLPADTAPIVAWAHQRGLAVIEDCCHVLGSRYRDLNGCWCDAGSLGDASFFSSQWSKPVSTGLGGWAVTKNSALAETIEQFRRTECVAPSPGEIAMLRAQVLARSALSSPRAYWLARSCYRLLSRAGICVGSSVEAELLGEKPPGYAKRMSGFQTKLLNRHLARAHEIIQHRRRLREVYEEALQAAGLPSLQIPDHADPVLLQYPVRVSNKASVLERARRHGTELGDWFDHPLHPKEANARAFGYEAGMCPAAERAASEVVNLPLHMGITEGEAVHTVRFLSQVGDFARERSAKPAPFSTGRLQESGG